VARIGNITFACKEPVRLAEFWAAALGYIPVEPSSEVIAQVERAIETGDLDPTGWAMLTHPDGVGPRLLFQRRAKTPTESIPIHLDLNVEDRDAEVRRLSALGATVVETKTQQIGTITETWTVMRDPEGNGFCVQ
jgi:Glyoxalase-like domain